MSIDLMSSRGLKVVSLLGGGTTFAAPVGVAFQVKVNTDQRGPLVGFVKCMPSQLYKGKACRATPSEGAIVENTQFFFFGVQFQCSLEFVPLDSRLTTSYDNNILYMLHFVKIN
jgi:hypothetical protein